MFAREYYSVEFLIGTMSSFVFETLNADFLLLSELLDNGFCYK